MQPNRALLLSVIFGCGSVAEQVLHQCHHAAVAPDPRDLHAHSDAPITLAPIAAQVATASGSGVIVMSASERPDVRWKVRDARLVAS